MSLLNSVKPQNEDRFSLVGVGLRHPHYQEALKGTSIIDFVEVHAENFITEGGALKTLLNEINEMYSVSLHSTSMGLGSVMGVNSDYLDKLNALVRSINPLLVSDHACFSWGEIDGSTVHAGDLLPLEFSRVNLDVLAQNVDRVQQRLGRQILVENLSSYIQLGKHSLNETEFLAELVRRTQCGLLVDLNNILVNLHNEAEKNTLAKAKVWLSEIPEHAVGEIHLAGYSPASEDELIIDDHSKPVSDECWSLYAYAIERFGPVTTLIEWDNELPDWHTLLSEACRARKVITQVCKSEQSEVLAYAW